MPPIRLLALLCLCAAAFAAAPATAAVLRVVAAESVYADLARRIGGPDASVDTVLTNPAQDAHLFEPGPDTARRLSGAAIVVYNGAGYDPWMRGLLSATAGGTPRRVIDVADLMHAAPASNPHLWYAPATLPAVARALAAAMQAADPAHAAGYRDRAAQVQARLDHLSGTVAAVRTAHRGAVVAATEPVFGLMLDALGMVVADPGFQRAVMNGTEPGAAETAALEQDLRSRRAQVLIRNQQTDSGLTRRMQDVAREAGVPVVAVSESQPAGMDYTDWVGGTLARLDQALNAAPGKAP